MLGGQATISQTQISQNRRFGISIFFGGSVTLQRGASLSNNFVGIFVTSARVALFNASVSDNSFLGIWLNFGQATIQNSTISGNGLQGIAIVDTEVMISGTVVDGNGTFSACSRPDQICNGITVEGWAKATIVDSTLRNNTDWGLSAVLKKCGYPSDGFTGGVTFQGSNTITGNNKARNHEGEICLP
jgi:hypothetical protein